MSAEDPHKAFTHAPERGLFAATANPIWSGSPSVTAAAAVAIALIGVGLILARVDLALLGLPLVAAASLSWARRPATVPATASIAVGDSRDSGRRDDRGAKQHPAGSDASAEVGYEAAIIAPPRTEIVIVRHSLLGGKQRVFAVSSAEAAELAGTVPLLHSGPQELLRLEYRLLGADGACSSTVQTPLIAERVVAPSQERLRALPMPTRLQGLTGQHESARAGDGGEFRDVHPFTAGDRLRRIDWKATARRGQNAGDLYVRRTNALADATVLIVLDSRDDVGEQVAEWNRNAAVEKGLSSLDVAREAAASLATAYVGAGDRVGFQDLSSRARMIAHAGGRRHLWKLLRAVETTEPATIRFNRQRPPIVPPGALVYLLSSLLDDQSVQLALLWRGNGHRVIAVDVLPAPRFDRASRYERIAHRLVMMERDDRIRVLRARGIELLRWRDENMTLPLQARLQLLSRPAAHGSPAGVRR